MIDRFRHSTCVRRRFSLIEMLAVLIIVGILLAAVMGSFNGIAKGNNVASSARMVSSQLFLARSYAVSQREYVAVVFSTDGTAVSTWLCTSGGVCTSMVPNTKWNQLATGAEVTLLNSTGDAVSGITGTVSAQLKGVVFKPSGSSIGAADIEIQVASATVDTNKLTMTVNWLTGRVSFPE